MRTKTKLTLAASFVGVVAMAAAAFGQAGAPTEGDEQSRDGRRAAAAKDGDRCGGDRLGRRAFRVVHSETKLKAPEGFAFATVDQGKVTAVDHAGKKITIERADGEKVTATAVDETTVCKDGKKASFDSIKVGDLARLVSARSERFTGLKRIAVHTPGTEPAAPERPRRAAPDAPSDPSAD